MREIKASKIDICIFHLRYILLHARRAVWKSTLVFMLAALFYVAIAQFNLTRQSYVYLCESLEITASFVGGVRLYAATQLDEMGYTTDPYYEGEMTVGVNLSEMRVVVTNDIARYTGEDVDIAYAEGYDASCMDAFENVVIVGELFLDMYGFEPGDTVMMISPSLFLGQVRQFVADMRPDYSLEEYSDGELLAMFRVRIGASAGVRMDEFSIAGVVSSQSGGYAASVFAPGTSSQTGVLGANAVMLDVAEFKLLHYRFADELRSYGESIVYRSSSGSTAFVMDTGRLKGPLDTLGLLDSLYPTTVAVALIIGGFLCALVIFQSSKDASIMRVLGATKWNTITALVLEQVILGAAGLAVGACAMRIYNAGGMAEISGKMPLFAALYFAALLTCTVASSILATHRSPLELLQLKE